MLKRIPLLRQELLTLRNMMALMWPCAACVSLLRVKTCLGSPTPLLLTHGSRGKRILLGLLLPERRFGTTLAPCTPTMVLRVPAQMGLKVPILLLAMVPGLQRPAMLKAKLECNPNRATQAFHSLTEQRYTCARNYHSIKWGVWVILRMVNGLTRKKDPLYT